MTQAQPSGEFRPITLSVFDGGAVVPLAVSAFVPHPLPPAQGLEWTEARARLLAEAAEWTGRIAVRIREVDKVGLLVNSFIRKEAVYSSRIEGTRTELSEVLAFESKGHGVTDERDALEVLCNVEAMQAAVAALRQGMPISVSFFHNVHAALMRFAEPKGQGGCFREIQNYIHRGGALTLAESVKFVPPPPVEVAPLMRGLCDYLTGEDAKKHHPLVNAALAHAFFEIIHPYADGNGRTGRILIPTVLIASGSIADPALPVSLFLKQRKEAYYALLLRVSNEGAWGDWVDFFLRAVIDAGREADAIITAYRELVARDGALVGRPSGSLAKVWQCFLASPVASVEKVAKESGLSEPTVYKATKELAALGVLHELPKSGKTSRMFAYVGMFKALRERAVFKDVPVIYDPREGDGAAVAIGFF